MSTTVLVCVTAFANVHCPDPLYADWEDADDDDMAVDDDDAEPGFDYSAAASSTSGDFLSDI